MNVALSKEYRHYSLQEMSKQKLDVLVIGGGITGAGVALDAVTRGLKVGIVEAQDWASGTSSRSSKLVHGGLRYLQMLDFKLVSEALHERELLLHTTAPHLVKPVPFIYPLLHRIWERPFTSSGIGLYDSLAILGSKEHSMPVHKHYSKKGVQKIFPDVNPDALIGGIKYYDAKVDDARLVVNVIRTAVSLGAYACSRTQVTKIHADEKCRVDYAVLKDLETGNEYKVHASKIVNATGVWTEKTQNLLSFENTESIATSGSEIITDNSVDNTNNLTNGNTHNSKNIFAEKEYNGLKVLASKGVHIVVPRSTFNGEAGFILQTEKSVLFIIPWKYYWIIGTTDTKYEKDLRNPCATKEDVDYIIEHANVILKKPIKHSDIIGVFSGLRPLLQPVNKNPDNDNVKSTKVSREHTVSEVIPGLVSIAGGKLTTYRVMGKDTIDFVLGEDLSRTYPSLTDSTPLLGAQYYKVFRRKRKWLSEKYGLSLNRIEDLLDRYGDNITHIIDLIDKDNSWALPIENADKYIRAEIAFACTHEGALHLEDIMLHRTRIVYEYADKGLSSCAEIASIMAEILDWDSSVLQREIELYSERCKAEQEALNVLTEDEAQEIRALVTEVTEMF